VKVLKSERAQLDLDAGLLTTSAKTFWTDYCGPSGEVIFGDSLRYKMSKATTLGWNLCVGERYLSNPVQGRQRNDLIVSSDFRLTFAR
jgi:hypothetical protein